MKADELTAEVKVLHERTGYLERRLDKLAQENDLLRQRLQEANVASAQVQQQLRDHIAYIEKWDARRWTTIGFFIAGLVTLVANLVLLVAKGSDRSHP